MSIRQTANRNPAITAVIVGLCAVVAIWFVWQSFFGGKHTYYSDTAYFTDDDGKTYFSDDLRTIVPYTKNGKEIVRAHVFRCPSKGTFVGFLQRYTPAAQDALREAKAAAKEGRRPAKDKESLAMMVDRLGSEYKKPGAGNPWRKGESGDVVASNRMALCDNNPGEVAENIIP